jgi:hypothetical protein
MGWAESLRHHDELQAPCCHLVIAGVVQDGLLNHVVLILQGHVARLQLFQDHAGILVHKLLLASHLKRLQLK